MRAVLLLLLLGACTIEPRWEVEEAPPDTAVILPVVETPEEGVRTTLEIYREAVRVGDLSLALSLLDRDAVLADDLADENGASTTRGELLMELRRRHATGLRLEVVDSRTREVDGVWLVSSRLEILHAGEEETTLEGHARESALLAPTDEGWRIVLFHRSRTP